MSSFVNLELALPHLAPFDIHKRKIIIIDRLTSSTRKSTRMIIIIDRLVLLHEDI